MSDMTPEEKLNQRLAEIDQQKAQAIATADEAMAAAEAAQETAGQEYDEAVAAAEAANQAATEQYQADLQAWDQKLNETETAVSQIANPDSAADEIALIGTVNDITLEPRTIPTVTVQTGGTPDCSAAQVQTAINEAVANAETALNAAIAEAMADANAALGQMREVRDEIVAALTALNEALTSLDMDKIREAIMAAKEASQIARNQMPDAADVEAEKASFHAALDSLFQ
ncbi:MAG: hypothetical protein AB1631_15770 [Acidobacteriota bacterium]